MDPSAECLPAAANETERDSRAKNCYKSQTSATKTPIDPVRNQVKKHLLLTISCLLLTAGLTFAQESASFSFNDNGQGGGTAVTGTYNPTATFNLDLFGTFTPGTSGALADGFSLWLQVPTANGFNTAINITAATMFQFPDKTHPAYPKVFNDAVGASAGYLTDHDSVGTNTGDLGATSNDPSQQFTGQKLLANYAFSLTNAAPGTYIMLSTTVSPKGSEISTNDFRTVFAGATAYTITIVPEPSTWSLVVVGALGAVGFSILRRRHRLA